MSKSLAKKKIVKTTFAQEVPEDIIVYELADKSGKAYTQEAEDLRAFRKFLRRNQDVDVWALNPPEAWDDYTDIFDLRFLFDDEEIWEERIEIILEEEAEGDSHCWSDQCDEVEYYDQLKEAAARQSKLEERPDFEHEDVFARDSQEAEESENWAEDDVPWRAVRYVNGIGFISDDYDSGHDEPNELQAPYPPVSGETFVDIFVKERRMKKCLHQLRRYEGRRAFEETRELCHRWKKMSFMSMRAEPSCSFH